MKAKEEILSFFASHRPRALSESELASGVAEQAASWRLPPSAQLSKLIDLLTSEAGLERVRLRSEEDRYRDIPRFMMPGCTPLEVAGSLRPAGYLSHGTAAFLHGLGEQVPRTYYVNREQSPKPRSTTPLTQASLDRAFKRKQRTSRFTFHLEGNRFTILSGKNTQDFGVENLTGPSGELLRCTNLERTLVDIVVRPAYAGGLYQVLEVFEAARDRGVDPERIVEVLGELDYVYPYHQAIGFMMERAGFAKESLAPLEVLDREFKFYLGYKMNEPEFDPSWQVFYPQGF